uniref:Uncharacterized protein n=1 Tax=Amphimedon queenslandica TaxID=400682 RepID=A0A1X7VKJ1_AMPQE
EKEELSCVSDNKNGRGIPVTKGHGRGRRQMKAAHSDKEELSCISDHEIVCGLPVTRGRGRRQTKAAHSEKEEILCISDNKDGRGLPVTRGRCRGRRPAKGVHSEKELSCISDNEDGCGLPVTRGLGCRQLKAVHSEKELYYQKMVKLQEVKEKVLTKQKLNCMYMDSCSVNEAIQILFKLKLMKQITGGRKVLFEIFGP